MRKARLLSTVAATLLLTVGAASAQTMKNDEAPGRAPAAQQNAPAEKIAPAQKIAPALKAERKTPETTGQAPPKEPVAGQMEKDTDVKKGDEIEKGRGGDEQARRAARPEFDRSQGEVERIRRERAQRDHRSGRSGRFGQAVDRATARRSRQSSASTKWRRHIST